MSATYTIGKSIDTNLPVHVKEAANGLKCNCVCYECNERLQAIQGKNENSREWHYRHDNTNSNCPGNNETALHQLAKLILYQNKFVETKKKKVYYVDANMETVIDKYRSDVSAKYNDQEIHFEVVVHHDLKADKKHHYQSNKINCIKIDLTDPHLLSAQPEQIKYTVIEDKTNKAFIQWNEDTVIAVPDSGNNYLELFLKGLIAFGSIFFIYKSLFSRNTRSGKYRRK